MQCYFPPNSCRIYSRPCVEVLCQDQMGVYGLFRNGCCVYIGKGDIRERLLAHLSGDNPRITLAAPTHYAACVTPNMDAIEKAMILTYFPGCNRRVG